MATLGLKCTVAMLMFAGYGSVASAQADDGAFITLGSRIDAPKGFIVMCSSDATFCAKPADTDDGDSKLVTGALAAKVLVARFAADRIVHPSQFRRSPKAAVSALGIPTSLAAQQGYRLCARGDGHRGERTHRRDRALHGVAGAGARLQGRPAPPDRDASCHAQADGQAFRPAPLPCRCAPGRRDASRPHRGTGPARIPLKKRRPTEVVPPEKK